jgi:hypothetical protein
VIVPMESTTAALAPGAKDPHVAAIHP